MKALVDGHLWNISFKYFSKGKPDSKRYRRGIFCYLEDTDAGKVFAAHSVCAPEDNFNKAVGRKLSFNKAVNLIEEKHKRTVLWEAFLQNCRI